MGRRNRQVVVRDPRTRVALVAGLALAVAGVLWLKPRPDPGAARAGRESQPAVPLAVSHGLPRLVDFGADECIPCKLMAPILEELRREYAGRLEIVFIDVWKDPGAGRAYGVYSIPTQIFYDATGRELLRHPGFISKADILARWKELGIDLGAPAGQVQP